MKIKLIPKDSINQVLNLTGVVTWYHSHGAFTFVFENGKARVFPEVHIWYVEQE